MQYSIVLEYNTLFQRKELYFLLYYLYLTNIVTSYITDEDFRHRTYNKHLKYDVLLKLPSSSTRHATTLKCF